MRVGPYCFQVTFSAHCRAPEGAKAAILRAARLALEGIPRVTYRKLLKPGPTYLMHVSLISQAEMKKLNGQYRGLKKVTDVLSFSRLEGKSPAPYPDAGDILICGARAREQASVWGNSLLEELSRLTVHGTLHLFGYDHERSPRDERVMFHLQDQILFRLPR